MEGLFTLFIIYIVAKAIFGGGDSKKSGKRRKRRSSWSSDSSYSSYDCWRKSHGDQNTLF